MSNPGDRAPSDMVQPDQSTTNGDNGRTPLMAVPEIRELSDALVANGYGDVVDKTEAFLEIDTNAMKIAALSKYGTLEQGSRDVAPSDGALWGLGDVDNPHTFIVRNSPNTSSLKDLGFKVNEESTKLNNRWRGDAYESFVEYMNELSKVIDRESERLRIIGQALYDVAQAIEQAQDNAETTFWGAAGVALTSHGVTTALLTGNGVLAALAGGLATAGSHAEQTAKHGRQLAEEQTNSELELTHPDYMESRPRENLQEYSYPKNPEQWRIDWDG